MSESPILIADSGSTQTTWCLLYPRRKKLLHTQGMSPYFLTSAQMTEIMQRELVPALGRQVSVGEIHFYGTGCSNAANVRIVRQALGKVFSDARIHVSHDLMAAARALCGTQKGIACILGTGSNSCYYNGSRIMKNNPGLGYILGDEGSGSYLGRKVLQYYLYHTFDDELRMRFEKRFGFGSNAKDEILDHVYKSPLANRYLASFSPFLAENRGHYMIENILEDSINDFFFYQIPALWPCERCDALPDPAGAGEYIHSRADGEGAKLAPPRTASPPGIKLFFRSTVAQPYRHHTIAEHADPACRLF